MNTGLPAVLGAVVAIGFLYPLSARVAGEMVQEQRKRLRKQAWRLLEDKNLSEDSREYVQIALKEAVSPWTFFKLIVMFPVILYTAVRHHGESYAPAPYRRKEVEQVAEDSLMSAMAANPFTAAIFLAICIIFLPVFVRVIPKMERKNWKDAAEFCLDEQIVRRINTSCPC